MIKINFSSENFFFFNSLFLNPPIYLSSSHSFSVCTQEQAENLQRTFFSEWLRRALLIIFFFVKDLYEAADTS